VGVVDARLAQRQGQLVIGFADVSCASDNVEPISNSTRLTSTSSEAFTFEDYWTWQQCALMNVDGDCIALDLDAVGKYM
jgi:hypothetical protein